ncbi:MAG: hypothetical protein AAB471_01860 [Patescibacteria group bacterium]
MKSLKESYKKDKFLHHAYLVRGEREFALPALTGFFEQELDIAIKGNPDLVILEYDTFGIDDGRFLKTLESHKSAGGKKKIFVIVSNFFTHEAQNALLKIFEDPKPDTHFFIISSNPETLLPTLKSRLYQISIESGVEGNKDVINFALEFLAMSPQGRLEAPFIKELIEEKNKQKAIVFADSITEIVYGLLKKELPARALLFEEILMCRGYLKDRSASLKLILEHLSLILPQIKK